MGVSLLALIILYSKSESEAKYSIGELRYYASIILWRLWRLIGYKLLIYAPLHHSGSKAALEITLKLVGIYRGAMWLNLFMNTIFHLWDRCL